MALPNCDKVGIVVDHHFLTKLQSLIFIVSHETSMGNFFSPHCVNSKLDFFGQKLALSHDEAVGAKADENGNLRSKQCSVSGDMEKVSP